MQIFSRFARGELPLTRIEEFRDGVFTIIMTLLVSGFAWAATPGAFVAHAVTPLFFFVHPHESL